ncbi:hypothetical protein SAMN05444363_2549 [Flavobacterium terrae]|uniref:Uncharacterized protein n=1 Tax=Flavobacterium terrae TaxID=415425 RepID=A0A1M6GDK6_9FLAO|nr:hypothetical protein SAMN05444363_2549 [Flavobacterium terrae]
MFFILKNYYLLFGVYYKNVIRLQYSKENKEIMKNQVLNMMMCMCCSETEGLYATR